MGNTEFYRKKFAFCSPVLFRGSLWVFIEVVREIVSTLLAWKHQIDVEPKIPITQLDVWIMIFKASLAGGIGCRLFLDQTYSRHIIDNMPSVKESETEFIRKQIAAGKNNVKST